MTIPPNIGFEDVSITATGGTQTRTCADRFGEYIVNVKEYGAIGDGTTDDAAAFQAAVDAAFAGGLTNPEQNKILYCPNGVYSFGVPIYIRNVKGGLIFGDGNMATTFRAHIDRVIAANGTYPENDDTGDDMDAIFVCTNVSNTRFEGFEVKGDTYTNTTNLVGIYFFCNDGERCEGNMLQSIAVGELSIGVKLGGAAADQHVRNAVFINVPFAYNLPVNGIRVESVASVGHVVISGGSQAAGRFTKDHAGSGTSFGTHSTYVPETSIGNAVGGIAAIRGQVAFICAQSTSGNVTNNINASKYPMCIFGSRDESDYWFQTDTVSTCSPDEEDGPAGPVWASGMVLVGSTTQFQHPPDSNTLPMPAGRPRCNMFDAFDGGKIHISSPQFGLGCRTESVSPEVGAFVVVDATSSAIAENVSNISYDTQRIGATYALDGGFFGEGNIFYTGSTMQEAWGSGGYCSWWTPFSFAGTFNDTSSWPVPFATSGIARGLPPASAQFKGARFTITDSPTAATAANFWTAVTTGGGSNIAPLFCDGTSWRIA